VDEARDKSTLRVMQSSSDTDKTFWLIPQIYYVRVCLGRIVDMEKAYWGKKNYYIIFINVGEVH